MIVPSLKGLHSLLRPETPPFTRRATILPPLRAGRVPSLAESLREVATTVNEVATTVNEVATTVNNAAAAGWTIEARRAAAGLDNPRRVTADGLKRFG